MRWRNTRTGRVVQLPDQPSGTSRDAVQRHRRMVQALDASARWERMDEPAPASESGGGRREALEGMTVAQLREQAAARGLPAHGTKAQLIERLGG